MKKEGQAIQFNWIYIASVSFIILLIIIFAANQIRLSKQNQENQELRRIFGSVLATAQSMPGSVYEITLIGDEIELKCDSYQLNDKSVSVDIFPLFGPSTTKDTIYVNSEYMQIPFLSIPLGYLSDNNKVYAIENKPLANKLMEIIPSPNKLLGQIQNPDPEKNYRLIYFDSPPENIPYLANLKDNQVSAVWLDISTSTNFPNVFGKATYFSKNNNNFVERGSVFFIDKATMIASIYSETELNYECNMEKVFRRLRIITDIKKDIVQHLFSQLPNCPYSKSGQYISQLVQAVNNKDNNRIYELGIKLKNENNILEALSCPLII